MSNLRTIRVRFTALIITGLLLASLAGRASALLFGLATPAELRLSQTGMYLASFMTAILLTTGIYFSRYFSSLKKIHGTGLEQRQQQRNTIGLQIGEISDLQAAKELLTLRNEQLAAEKYSLNQRLERSEASSETLRQELAAVRLDLDGARAQLSGLVSDLNQLQDLQQNTLQQLADLRQRYGDQSQELQAAKGLQRRSGQQLNTLRGEYNELKVKYDELVRPARTPEGRYLVEVRYSKRDGKFRIEYSTADQPVFRRISRDKLDSALAALKAAKPEGLYIKIIFPDSSGLTFNEAWSFTSDLHSRYDYYSQDKPGQEAPATGE